MSDHAVFLIHGLWGNRAHFWYVEQQLRQTHPSLKIHACAVNEGNKTYDGIDVGGDRVVAEIQETLTAWSDAGDVITKISIVGYSLGGLISRYVIGLLYARGVFEKMQPVNFTTFATPHLGILHVNPGFLRYIANHLGPRLLSSSGRQMFIADRTPRPLLLRMTDKDSIFIKGLALFKTRTTYANIVNDRSVPYYTAAITQYDPYLDMARLNLTYLPDYAPTILHPTHPIFPRTKPKENSRPSTTRRFLLPIALAILIPLWATFFVMVNLYQSFFSARRIRQHLQLQGYNSVEETGLSGAVQETFEDVVDNANIFSPSEDREEYLHNVSEETPLLNGNGNVNGRDSEKEVSFKREEYRLALTEEQLSMISGLRSLSWQTFGVHISQSMHSHAAIIRRTKWRKELVEGNIVIKHWIDEQFRT